MSEMIVGVLGGGQLGRMLCQAASQMAIKVMVLDPQENCPASSLSYDHMVGNFDDSATVQEFAKRYTLLQFGFIYIHVFWLFFYYIMEYITLWKNIIILNNNMLVR